MLLGDIEDSRERMCLSRGDSVLAFYGFPSWITNHHPYFSYMNEISHENTGFSRTNLFKMQTRYYQEEVTVYLVFLVICVMDESTPCSAIQTIITDFFIPYTCTYLHVTLFCLLVKFYSYLFLLKQRKKTVEHIIWHILYFCSHMRSSSLLTIWNTVQWQSNYLTCVSL